MCVCVCVAREDLARLQRGYRVKEKERKTEGDQAQNSIRKQRLERELGAHEC